MDFDLNTLRGLLTLLLMLFFIGLCVWAYSKKRKPEFDEAAELPFADEEINRESQEADEKRRGVIHHGERA